MQKTLTKKISLTLIAELVLLIAPILVQGYINPQYSLQNYYLTWIVLVIAINLALIIMLITGKPKNFKRYIPFLLLMPVLPVAIFIFLISSMGGC